MAPQMKFMLSPCQEVVFLTPLIAYPMRRSCPSPKNICQSHPGDSQPIPGGIILPNPQTSLPYIFASTLHRPGTPTPPQKKKNTWVALNDPRVLTITTSQNNIWETFKTLYNILLNWLVHRDPEIIGLWNNPQYKLGYINDALEYIPKIPTVFAYCSHEPTWMSRLEVSKKVRKQVIITPINPQKKTSRWKNQLILVLTIDPSVHFRPRTSIRTNGSIRWSPASFSEPPR